MSEQNTIDIASSLKKQITKKLEAIESASAVLGNLFELQKDIDKSTELTYQPIKNEMSVKISVAGRREVPEFGLSEAGTEVVHKDYLLEELLKVSRTEMYNLFVSAVMDVVISFAKEKEAIITQLNNVEEAK